MDTFVESSWYYTRYCCNDQDTSMLDDRAKYWTPVDQYVGGIEHAVMHLLYARFMHKVLRDEGLVNSNEPFLNLLTQGMVLKDGAKMSKSKGNTVSPQSMIKQYGCDAVRFFIIFAAPPEQDLEWSDTGIEGAYRFLRKLWQLAQEQKNNITQNTISSKGSISQFDDKSAQKIHCQIHKELQRITYDIERKHFNTVASGAMKLLNIAQSINPTLEHADSLMLELISIILRVLSPITPHICHHLWKSLEFEGDILNAGWPKVNPKALIQDEIEVIVQVNGKRRTSITIKADESNERIEEIVKNNKKLQPHIAGKTIKRFIIVPKRLINIVV